MSDFWRQWESQLVNGRFPLRRFLGESNHSAVFLTEFGTPGADAAIKFIRDEPSFAGMQLERWRAAAALSHSHLIRLFETGRCRLGNYELLFVVMEYAEQTLAEILTLRALTFDEVRQMSGPALAALSFLHRSGWVHGQVKPTNVCVVRDELKLSSDTLRPAGDPLTGSLESTEFQAPEERSGDVSAAGDVWGMGMTLVAALNQHPAPPDASSPPVPMPSTVPPAFADAIRRSLSPNAAQRPTAAELQAQLMERDTPASAPRRPNVATQPSAASSSMASRSQVPRAPLVGAMIGIIVLLAVLWGSVRLMHGRTSAGPTPGTSALSAAASASDPHHPGTEAAPAQTGSRAARRPAPPTAAPADPVLYKEIPAVPRSALRTIRGRIEIFVTVSVDASGNVVDQTLERSSSSRYFARAAAGAARKWRFAPAAAAEARRWRLRFEFTRTGLAANASPAP